MSSVYNETRRRLYVGMRSGGVGSGGGQTNGGAASAAAARSGKQQAMLTQGPAAQFWMERYFGAAPDNYNQVMKEVADDERGDTVSDTSNAEKKGKRIWKPHSTIEDHESFHKKRRLAIRQGAGGDANTTLFPTTSDLISLVMSNDIPTLSTMKYKGEKKNEFAEWNSKTKAGKQSRKNFDKWLRNVCMHLADCQHASNERKITAG